MRGAKRASGAADARERSQQILREVDAVDRHVEQVAGAGQVPGTAASPNSSRASPRNRWLRKCRGSPSCAAGDQMLQIAHRRGKAIGERRHVHHAGVAGRVIHLAHFAGVQAQRLLAHHVLAVRRGGQRRSAVCVKLGVAMITASTFGIGADRLADRCVTLSMPQSAAALVQQLGIGVAGGHQRGPRIEPDGRHVVIIADRAGADDGDADRLADEPLMMRLAWLPTVSWIEYGHAVRVCRDRRPQGLCSVGDGSPMSATIDRWRMRPRIRRATPCGDSPQ